MKSWLGSYYTSPGAEPVEATVLAVEKRITIGFRQPDGSPATLSWDMKDINASFENSLQASRLTHTGNSNARLIIANKDAAAFIQEMQAEQGKPWYRKDKAREWKRNLLIFLGVAGALVIAYFLLVPWFSEKLASGVSVEREEQFGNAIYKGLNIASGEDTAASAIANEFFREMDIATPYNIRIAVIRGGEVNAFALPGGHIVIYDALLKQLKTYPELAALLSHEFTHVNNKHSTKSIFRRLGSSVFLGLLFGKTGNVSSVLVDQADNLKSLNYSRGMEKEADISGLDLLKARKIDPEGFTRLFEHLKTAAPASALPELLASHPDIDNRIAYIREASAGADVEENVQLKTIFDKLKTNTQP